VVPLLPLWPSSFWLSWVPSFYQVWQGFIIIFCICFYYLTDITATKTNSMSRMDVPKTNVMITLWVGFLFCKMSLCKAGLYVWWGLPPIWWEFTFCNSYHRIWEHPCPCPLSTPNTTWKITPPCPSSLPPTRKKREAPSLHDATSHWLHAIFFPKLSYHYFWPGLFKPILRISYLLCLVIPWE